MIMNKTNRHVFLYDRILDPDVLEQLRLGMVFVAYGRISAQMFNFFLQLFPSTEFSVHFCSFLIWLSDNIIAYKKRKVYNTLVLFWCFGDSLATNT